MEKAIRVEGLKKYYKEVRAVDDISFSVENGELFGFLGVNGAGKSTTISILCTISRPTAGTVTICGRELGKQDDKIRERIGVVWQKNFLDEMLTVRENLIIRASLYGYSGPKIREQVKKAADQLQLSDIMDRLYRHLSGGQKRRAEIAAALLNEPEILFLDEPTTGLDPAARKLVWENVETLKDKGMTIFLTTHYMEEAAKADHIAVLSAGKIAAFGTPFSLKEKYAKDRLVLYRKDREIQTIELENTMDALRILNEKQDQIEGFEVIQGTMDDVFLNITGREPSGDQRRCAR